MNASEIQPAPPVKKTRAILLARIQSEIEVLQERAEKIKSLPDSFDELDIPATTFGGFVDFDRLSHPEIIRVVKVLGSKWDKTSSAESARIDYQTTLPNGLTVRCWAGEPPPNCKIVEVLETIPAQAERIITKRQLVCQ